MWRDVDDVAFDLLAPATVILDYNALDLRLAWRCRLGLEVSVVGKELLDAEHPEYASRNVPGKSRTEGHEEVYGMLTGR